MLDLSLIEKPTVLLDEARARRNLATMAAKARRQGVRFRPHFKTHQSAEMGEWFRQEGVQAITVSSVDMAQYFAGSGWQDILIAFTANPRQVSSLNQLASQIHLELLVESPETVTFLQEHLTQAVDVWLKVDVGAHRTGIPVDDHSGLLALAKDVRGPRLRLRGLLTHAGHTYHPGSQSIPALYQRALGGLQRAQAALCQAGFSGVQISYGDTPSCTLVEDFDGLDEIRPGNFIFYDLMQHQLGVCGEDAIAVAVACPVVAKHAETVSGNNTHRLVLYGGAVHLSKEALEAPGGVSYGGLAPLAAAAPHWGGQPVGWGKMLPGAHLYALSQEHGLAMVSPEQYDQIQVGDLVAVIPVHSCLTVDLHRQYLTLEGRYIPLKA
jgi:D-serine deaminase-like pyridoxal phosphate-dependent protein